MNQLQTKGGKIVCEEEKMQIKELDISVIQIPVEI